MSEDKGVALTSSGGIDGDVADTGNYMSEIVDEEDNSMEEVKDLSTVKGASHPSAGAQKQDAIDAAEEKERLDFLKETRGTGKKSAVISERESDYMKQRFDRGVDPVGEDDGYAANMKRQLLARSDQKKDEEETQELDQKKEVAKEVTRKRRRRWDDPGESSTDAVDSSMSSDETAGKSGWADSTPVVSNTFALDDATPVRRTRNWDETPQTGGASTWDETPKPTGSRWDETPKNTGSRWDETPQREKMVNQKRVESEMTQRNLPLSDTDLDSMLPKEGYHIMQPPISYKPIHTPSRKLMATPTPRGDGLFTVTEGNGEVQQAEAPPMMIHVDGEDGLLPGIKEEDMQYFGKLAESIDESKLSKEALRDRKIMRLLLQIKSGLPSQRKAALRQITANAREFGAGPLFNQILPLLMSPALEDQERHLLVKVIDRVLYKLDDLVRPYAHKILVVIEPMLIDEDYYARVEGREIIANLAKAAGLPTMIASMRADIDHVNDFVRNTTARAFAVVASALGIGTMVPFLKAVCQSKKSWQARQTGSKIVQQIAILVGCSVLPHLTNLVKIVEGGLTDQQHKVRMNAALALASLAESAYPYGIESFDTCLEPLWRGVRQHQGKGLAAFLKAIGFIIPLMDDDEYAAYFTQQVMAILIREFRSPDEEMRRIVLKVINQCISTDGVTATYVRDEVAPDFFKSFWVHRMALERRNFAQLVETTVAIAGKIGGANVISRIVTDFKDDSEAYRRMVMEATDKILQQFGANDVDMDLEQRLVDGALFAFQEQAVLGEAEFNSHDQQVMLNGFGVIVNSLGLRAKPYIPQVCGTIKFRLHHKDALVRMQAADLVARVAGVMKVCDEEQLMAHLGVVLFENLGEEYPEVLGSMIGGLCSIVNVIGMNKMNPPIRDLLPRLTPILKNRHEKVQENCIDLVGRIADRGAEFVAAREWMRICFELIELLRANKKSIRRASVNTFGYIAKAIGPQDVLHTLLNNLKVQDRQMRVCTTIAIAIVAESCGPFTVLPALLNEYRYPDLNVQNGVLKALSFLFEYIGDTSKDYVYAVVTLLEDALKDRDQVHRQTACTAVKHLALGLQGQGCEDALIHLLNFVWPNIFEESPHVIGAVFDAIEGLRVSLGAQVILNYVWQGIFHPSRPVRESYWKVYNNLYVYSQESMVPVYPRLEDDYDMPEYDATELEGKKKSIMQVLMLPKEKRVVRNSYVRTHLDLFV